MSSTDLNNSLACSGVMCVPVAASAPAVGGAVSCPFAVPPPTDRPTDNSTAAAPQRPPTHLDPAICLRQSHPDRYNQCTQSIPHMSASLGSISFNPESKFLIS